MIVDSERHDLESNVTQITIQNLESGNYSVSVVAITRCETSGQSADDSFFVGKCVLKYV